MHHLIVVHSKNPLKLQHSQTNLNMLTAATAVAEEVTVAAEEAIAAAEVAEVAEVVVMVDVVDTNKPPPLEVVAKSICVLTTSASLWEKTFMSSSTL